MAVNLTKSSRPYWNAAVKSDADSDWRNYYSVEGYNRPDSCFSRGGRGVVETPHLELNPFPTGWTNRHPLIALAVGR